MRRALQAYNKINVARVSVVWLIENNGDAERERVHYDSFLTRG